METINGPPGQRPRHKLLARAPSAFAFKLPLESSPNGELNHALPQNTAFPIKGVPQQTFERAHIPPVLAADQRLLGTAPIK